MIVSTTIDAPADTVFGVLADPSTHEAIDGTGWVRHSLDGKRLTETGQIFRMAMYHDNHPDKDYEMANKVIGTTRRKPSRGNPAKVQMMPISNSADGFGDTTCRRSGRPRRRSR